MISRDARSRLASLLGTFPVVLVLGPRQCGKTTLARSSLPGWRYLDLERPRERAALESDPEDFFARYPHSVVLDEAQRLPWLMPLLRGVVDRERRPGRFVLTGSAHPSLLTAAGETLAGRIGILELTPFGVSELASKPRWAAQRWFWGGYPPLFGLARNEQKQEWLDSYAATFLERDLPALGIRVPAARVRRLWTMLAHCHGGLLNTAELARSLDLHHHVVTHYLDLLEGAFAIRRLQPYFANVKKRLTKSPKVYLRDTGLLHYLAGLRRPEDLETWPGRGASWEGFLVEELARRAQLRFPGSRVWFWRTQAGAEVDLIIENGRRRVAVEIKAGARPEGPRLAGLRQCMADLGLKRGFVLYRGEETLPLGRGIDLLPWERMDRVLEALD